MKVYKGFDKDLTCRGFKYEIGETYEEENADLCSAGFHACEAPLDVFGYYAPGSGNGQRLPDLARGAGQENERSHNMITIKINPKKLRKINPKKLRKIAERILSATFLITFFLLLGFAGSCEVGDATASQFIIRSLPTLAVMGLAAAGLNKLDQGEGER